MSEEDKISTSVVSQKLIECLSLSSLHAASLSSRTSASCIRPRRAEVLENTTAKLSSGQREWLHLQPLLQKSGLFAKALPQLQKELSADLSELQKGLSLFARPPRSLAKYKGKQYHKQSYHQTFDLHPGHRQGRGRRSGQRDSLSRRGKQQFAPSTSSCQEPLRRCI